MNYYSPKNPSPVEIAGRARVADSMMRGVTDSSQSGLTDTLRWSYLMTLPFFNTVAILSNVLILCMFSVEKMKVSVMRQRIMRLTGCLVGWFTGWLVTG